MKPEDLTAYKKMIDQLKGADRFRQSAVEQQVALAKEMSRKLRESAFGFQPPSSDTEMVRQIAIREHQRLKELMLPTAGSAVSEIIRNIQGSQVFDIARFTAANAAAEAIKSLRQFAPDIGRSFLEINRRAALEHVAAIEAFRSRNREETLRIAASISRLNAAESIRPLTAVFQEQLKSLEEQSSQFAQSMAQTLKTQFDEFEERYKASFEQLEIQRMKNLMH